MKKLLLLTFLFSQILFSQSDYFNGNYTVCPIPQDQESKDNYKLGIDCIKANLYLGGANKLFLNLIKKDSTFCDAYFFAGYTFRLSKMYKEALTFYYIADSLSNNKSIIFKQNLAYMATQLGAVKLARKKFDEMKQYFPKSPEGYYGIASTSIFIGDIDNGLENIKIAMQKYIENGISLGDEIYFTQAILLTRNKKYYESVEIFDRLRGDITRNDEFRIDYAYSLLQVAKDSKDEKLMKKAKKMFDKIEDKSNLTEAVIAEFK
jgi:tetratricopeptide (TPR) repeat protein